MALSRGTAGRECRSERERTFWESGAAEGREKGTPRKERKNGRKTGDEKEERKREVRVGWHFYWSLGIRCPTTAVLKPLTSPLSLSSHRRLPRPLPPRSTTAGPVCHPAQREPQPFTLARQISLASRTSSSRSEPLLQDLPTLFHDRNDTVGSSLKRSGLR